MGTHSLPRHSSSLARLAQNADLVLERHESLASQREQSRGRSPRLRPGGPPLPGAAIRRSLPPCAEGSLSPVNIDSDAFDPSATSLAIASSEGGLEPHHSAPLRRRTASSSRLFKLTVVKALSHRHSVTSALSEAIREADQLKDGLGKHRRQPLSSHHLAKQARPGPVAESLTHSDRPRGAPPLAAGHARAARPIY
jgi:hypothetical protein